MKKYLSDMTTNDVLLIGGREVVLDLLDYNTDTGLVLVSGYFEDHGDDYTVQTFPDKVYTVRNK